MDSPIGWGRNRWEVPSVGGLNPLTDVIADGGVRHGFHEQVWKPKGPLKVKLLAWRISHGRLPTQDRLPRLLPDMIPICYLCGAEEESLDYLFVGYFCSQGVWMEVTRRTSCIINLWRDVRCLLREWTALGPLSWIGQCGGLSFMLLYGHCGERNHRIFRRESCAEEALVDFVWARVKEWAITLSNMNLVDTPGTNVILQRQQRLTEEFVPRADLVVFVLSSDRPLTESEVVLKLAVAEVPDIHSAIPGGRDNRTTMGTEVLVLKQTQLTHYVLEAKLAIPGAKEGKVSMGGEDDIPDKVGVVGDC
ncbi:hypothetical protein Taro_020063 [Colocasia esculenta]|uniref:Reverse transcriptase zinc-binding domain-containing protein n=1 Tax=Colocasia esculenta TaxID=4460 RepID=A0A843UMN4_COLES|nr:hypothetical protein [Colocasia esculenta]